jgi:flagellar basal body-associated protein FliL
MLSKLSRFKLPIIVLIIAGIAAAGGLTMAKKMKGGAKTPTTKLSVKPIEFTKPFIVNLADTDAMHYIKLSLAVKLAPMSEEQKMKFEPEAGGEGAADVKTGPMLVADDTELRDAVIRTVSQFTSEELLSIRGKAALETKLLAEFDRLRRAQVNEMERTHQKKEDRNPAEPPYDIADVDYSEFSIQ